MREIDKFILRCILVIVLIILFYWVIYTKGQVAMCKELGYKEYATTDLLKFDCRIENNLNNQNNWNTTLPELYDY